MGLISKNKAKNTHAELAEELNGYKEKVDEISRYCKKIGDVLNGNHTEKLLRFDIILISDTLGSNCAVLNKMLSRFKEINTTLDAASTALKLTDAKTQTQQTKKENLQKELTDLHTSLSENKSLCKKALAEIKKLQTRAEELKKPLTGGVNT